MTPWFAPTQTTLAGLVVLQGRVFADARGEFSRLFCHSELGRLLGSERIEQVNRSLTSAIGTVRGMHFQHSPHGETKIVRCTYGRVWDVAVDLRRGSPTYLRWHAEELSAQNNKAVLIPAGFAHGYQALESECELIYFHTTAYRPAAEGGVRCDDPLLDISWPLPVSALSARDAAFPLLEQSFAGFE